MKPEVKAKWLAALRGDEYKQGRRRLRVAAPSAKERFCCLGVLCDIVAPELWKAPIRRHSSYTQHGLRAYPPEAVFDRAGIAPWSPDIWDMAQMNDSGTSFNEIADFIERIL